MAASMDQALAYALSKMGAAPTLTLKEEQRRAMQAVLAGKDIFMWLPTGFGKSICFQALPFAFDYMYVSQSAPPDRSIVLVVAPLIALMEDQVRSLRAKGVNAVVLSSGGREGKVSPELVATDESLEAASLVFSSPEALMLDKWRDALEQESICGRVRAVVVDEAHCISKWYELLLFN